VLGAGGLLGVSLGEKADFLEEDVFGADDRWR
jgi:hypothetical protein